VKRRGKSGGTVGVLLTETLRSAKARGRDAGMRPTSPNLPEAQRRDQPRREAPLPGAFAQHRRGGRHGDPLLTQRAGEASRGRATDTGRAAKRFGPAKTFGRASGTTRAHGRAAHFVPIERTKRPLAHRCRQGVARCRTFTAAESPARAGPVRRRRRAAGLPQRSAPAPPAPADASAPGCRRRAWRCSPGCASPRSPRAER